MGRIISSDPAGEAHPRSASQSGGASRSEGLGLGLRGVARFERLVIFRFRTGVPLAASVLIARWNPKWCVRVCVLTLLNSVVDNVKGFCKNAE